MNDNSCETGLEIAVIGMAGRFPGAKNIERFWENLKNGTESLTFYTEGELLEAGIGPGLLKEPNYVKAGGGILEDIEYFDPFFFGYSVPEAEIMDPQIRIFHENAWHALEDAGWDPFSYDGSIGLYAGASFNLTWEAKSLLSGRVEALGGFATGLLMDRDYLCTRVSYTLNLKGPSVVVKTACSTSLAAVHMACQAILNGECDMALAGGVTIIQSTKSGYLYREDLIASPDGHCRAFDARAKGTVGGNGIGIVVLKRLEEAIAHRDHIYAVIKGSAVNNDGIRKAGYTAPSIVGQTEVIEDALHAAEVDPETVTYVETHGTGTVMGDPIEIEGLKAAFNTDKKGFCRIGSVKTNIGHLDSAAGIAGLIKTALALKHKLIPPSLNFKTPNPRIDFDNSPFYINTELTEWKRDGHPLRAGVSSFGIGGTNAHVVLEEGPEDGGRKTESGTQKTKEREHRLLLLSAKTPSALDKMTDNLLDYLKDNLISPMSPDLADTAYTLQVGRRVFPHRRMAVCRDVNEAIDVLSSAGRGKMRTGHAKEEKKSVIFLFPGLGSQYVSMGLDLYNTESVFREEMDRCFEILAPLMKENIKEIMYPSPGGDNSKQINRPEIAQPAVFILEYALTELLSRWGIKPRAMIGYSFGEYTAACVSGVFSLESALKLIVTRGQLIGRLTSGSMLSVPLPIHELKPLMSDKLSIAIDNGPSVIVAGPDEAIDAFEEQLNRKKYLCMKVPNSHALHSKMMEPVLKEFEKEVGKVELNRPQIPYISNLTGTWITVREALDPAYWARHLRETVRFADGIDELKKEPNALFIEVGPGRDLRALVIRETEKQANAAHRVLNLIRPPRQETPDHRYLLNKIGQLWLHGAPVDWKAFYDGEKRQRVPLPTYPFDHRRYRLEGNPFAPGEEMFSNTLPRKKEDPAEWFYLPQWGRSALSLDCGPGTRGNQNRWLLFTKNSPTADRLIRRLKEEHRSVTQVGAGTGYHTAGSGETAAGFTIEPGNPAHYERLFKELAESGNVPDCIVHMWCLPDNSTSKNKRGKGGGNRAASVKALDQTMEMGLHSLLHIARAIGENSISNDIRLGVVTDVMQPVTGEENLRPEKAAVLGPVKVIPLEYSNIKCLSIDIIEPGPDTPGMDFIIDSLLKEFAADIPGYRAVAYRRTYRWIETYEPVKLGVPPPTARLKEKGVYLVTGGFGGMGFLLAEDLARTLKARLILVDILDYPANLGQDEWLSGKDRKEDIRLKKQKIKELEKDGAEFQIHDADVSDYRQMKTVVEKAVKRFGKINGVIHTAGLIDYAGIIQRRSPGATEALLAAKIKGTLVLDRLLDHFNLDFTVLFSSITNIFHKLTFGQVSYNAGHEFLDVFSYQKQKEGRFTVTVDWNTWAGVGMVARAVRHRNVLTPFAAAGSNENENILLISPSEGIEAFYRILGADFSRVIVLTRDLNRTIRYIDKPGTGEPGDPAQVPGTGRLYERPTLDTEYIPPSDEKERALVDVWQTLFGVQPIGIADDFFDLGGDSLKATAMLSQVNRRLEARIPLAEVFNRPTIRGLAEYLHLKETEDFKDVDKNLVLLREGTEKNNHLFLIHAGTGEVEVYLDFCNLLSEEFNFWGMKADRIENYTPLNITIEEIGERYIQKIKTVQPCGPYQIAGWCTGGVIALAMTRLLEEQGEEVKFLGLIETPLPQLPNHYVFNIENDTEGVLPIFPSEELKKRLTVISEYEQFWPTLVDYLEEIQADVEVLKQQLLPPFAPRVYPHFDRLSLRELVFYRSMAQTFERAECIYVPNGKVNAPAYVFEALKSEIYGRVDWNNYCGNIGKIYKIDADHFTLFDQDVEVFAGIFHDALQEALDGSPGGG